MDSLEPQEKTGQAPRIHLLPEHMVDQIKAGEVLERPSGLLKELLENALDAGAQKISLQIQNNGLDLLSIEDDGHGMALSELPLAFARHATSKIREFSDLYRLQSYGFRGEALAATAGVSRLSCTSYSNLLESGGKIMIEGGNILGINSWQGPQGTSIYVRDLFFNTPARLKFIRSKLAEKNAIKKIWHSFLLAHPSVHFSLKWDEAEREIYPQVSDVSVRAKKIFFKSSPLPLNYFEQAHEQVRSWAYFCASTGQAKQFIFVNNRLVLDKNLHQSLVHGLDALWKGESGHYVLFVNLPGDQVDVNVHPNKTTVKFERPSLIHSLVYAAAKKAAQTLSSSAQLGTAERPKAPTPTLPSSLTRAPEEFSAKLPSRMIKKIDDRFSLWEENERWFFFDGGKFFSQIWNLYVEANGPHWESQSLPLLVGLPLDFPLAADARLLEAKKCGLEIDRLSSHKVVIRSIPALLNQVERYPKLLGDLLSFLASSRSPIETFFAQYRGSSLTWDAQLAHKYFPSTEDFASKLKNIFQNCLEEINTALIQRIFEDT